MSVRLAEKDRKELSPRTRNILAWIAAELRKGYTGTFTIDCSEGGIRNVREGRDRPASDFDTLRKVD